MGNGNGEMGTGKWNPNSQFPNPKSQIPTPEFPTPKKISFLIEKMLSLHNIDS